VALGPIIETIVASSKTQVKILNAIQGLHAKFDGTYDVFLRRGRLRILKADHELISQGNGRNPLLDISARTPTETSGC
jgi:hypothetical protein